MNALPQSSDVLTVLTDAWRKGRTIVPLFGAGCSYDAGMPVVKGIQRYLYKFRAYLDECLFLGKDGKKVRDDLEKAKGQRELYTALLTGIDKCKLFPSAYLEIFGWPGRFEVHAEIAGSLVEGERVEKWMGSAKDKVIKESAHSEQAFALEKFIKEANDKKVKVSDQDINWYLEDWRDTIAHFTDHDTDLADALINRLHIDRIPALAHQYAAFLTRLNYWTILLTFNFDQYFELALRQQDIPHRVFALEEGAQFPGELLTRNTTAVLKLHGDTHRLLLDHRLDQPLTTDYLKRLHKCLQGRGSQPPLLLVLGCSGGDRRVKSVVDSFLKEGAKQGANPNSVTVAWVHFEPKFPAFLEEYEGTQVERPGVRVQRSLNPGYFLKALYGRLTDRYPSSLVPYLTHSERPIGFASKVNSAEADSLKNLEKQPFAVISTFTTLNADSILAGSTASQCLAEVLRDHSGIHHVIWVDLEACYSLADIVVTIVDQAKRYDTGTTPIAMAHDSYIDGDGKFFELDNARPALSSHEINRAVDRVLRILRRAHFFLALDGLETLTWPPTAHHGEVEQTLAYMKSHLGDVINFLTTLAARRDSFGGSRVVVSIDPPQPRHRGGGTASRVLEQYCEDQKSKLGNAWLPLQREPSFKIEEVLDRIRQLTPNGVGFDQAAFRLSCFRRTRCHVELKQAFSDNDEQLKAMLDAYCHAEYLFRVEGDGFWMNRSLRNLLYSHFTTQTSSKSMDKILKGCPAESYATWPDDLRKQYQSSVQQTLQAFTEHDCIATSYFEFYLASKDPTAFFEYVYHRVSCIRYLTKCQQLIGLAPDEARQALRDTNWILRKNSRYGNDLEGRSWKEFLASNDDLEKAVGSILTARYHFLLDAWRESAESLRHQAPAGQIIFWVRWILADDFDRMFGKEIKLTPAEGKETPGRLKNLLLALWGKCAFERMDFVAAAAVFDRLATLDQGQAADLAELAVLVSKAYGAAFSGDDPEQWRKINLTKYDKAKKRRVAVDAQLWKLSSALVELESPARVIGPVTVPSENDPDFDCRELSGRFFEFVGEPGNDDEKIRIFNMWVHIQDARLKALRLTEGDSAEWKEIYDKLDRARSLASGSPRRQATVELFAGVIIRQHLERLALRNGVPKVTEFAGIKARSLRSTLDRARGYLLRGRRNTRWWRLYFRLEIRWAFWDLLMLRWQVEEKQIENKAALARLRETVAIAVAAIRSRLDLDLEGFAYDDGQFRKFFPMLQKWRDALRGVAVLIAARLAKAAFPRAVSEEVKGVGEKAAEMFDWASMLSGLPAREELEGANTIPGEAQVEQSPNVNKDLYRIVKPLLMEYMVGKHKPYWVLADPG